MLKRQSFIFKNNNYLSGMKVVVLIHDQPNNHYIVKWTWVNFYTKNAYRPYQLTYEGNDQEKANLEYEEEMKRWA